MCGILNMKKKKLFKKLLRPEPITSWMALTCDRLTMLLSSLCDSSTTSLLGLCFCLRMAVEKSSSALVLQNNTHGGTLRFSVPSRDAAELYLESSALRRPQLGDQGSKQLKSASHFAFECLVFAQTFDKTLLNLIHR